MERTDGRNPTLALAEATIKEIGRSEGLSVHAQSPRQLEHCAELGRTAVYRGACVIPARNASKDRHMPQARADHTRERDPVGTHWTARPEESRITASVSPGALRRVAISQRSVPDLKGLVSDAHRAGVMGDEYQPIAPFPARPGQECHDALRVAVIEIAGGLVRKN